ncbi:MAG: TAT-variant-translocated molybdopterin oxidoreductase, partial [Candidatus Binataceae bacterium]
LESWSDARAYDGTISIIQPMIDPLYGGKSAHDVFQAVLANPQLSAYDVVQANAKTYVKGDFATSWRKALHDGWVEETAFTAKAGAPAGNAMPFVVPAPATDGYEISFRPDPSLYDGRYANVGWLQELPKQVTNMSWDNAALMSMASMADLKVEEADLIEIDLNGRKVTAPVLMAPGHPDGAITVHLGLGRRAEAGRVGAGVGFDAYPLRTADAPYYQGGGTVKKAGSDYDLCVTKIHNIEHRGSFAQHDLEQKKYDTEGTFSLAGHEAMERSIIRYATVAEVKENPNFAHEGGASGTLIGKVGYAPQGEKPGDDETFFPTTWNYKKTDPATLKVQNAWG